LCLLLGSDAGHVTGDVLSDVTGVSANNNDVVTDVTASNDVQPTVDNDVTPQAGGNHNNNNDNDDDDIDTAAGWHSLL